MTKEQYDIYIKTLPEDGQNAFRYKGVRYFINHNSTGWNIDKVTETKNGDLSLEDKFETMKVYSTVDELVLDKIFEGKSLNDIYTEIEYAEF